MGVEREEIKVRTKEEIRRNILTNMVGPGEVL